MKSHGQQSAGQASRLSPAPGFFSSSGNWMWPKENFPFKWMNEVRDRRDACPAGWLQACCLAAFCCAVTPLWGATNSESEDEILKLSPPHGELPPTLWEQYGAWTLLAAVVLVALASFVAWWWLRPKPPVVVPIEVRARQELAVFQQRNEDGRTLSQVSRVLRRYVVAAFELPPDELVTSEFCRLLAGHERIGPELAAAVGEFLRRCDEHKFAPPHSPTPMEWDSASSLSSPAGRMPVPPGAAARALELVELGEARRAQVRETATAAAAGPSTQRA